MLKGFDGSVDGQWPDLSLIMYSPVAEEKAKCAKFVWTQMEQKTNRIILINFFKETVHS